MHLIQEHIYLVCMNRGVHVFFLPILDHKDYLVWKVTKLLSTYLIEVLLPW